LYVQTGRGYAWIYISDPAVTIAIPEHYRRFNTTRLMLMDNFLLIQDYQGLTSVVYDLMTSELILFDKKYKVSCRSSDAKYFSMIEFLDISGKADTSPAVTMPTYGNKFLSLTKIDFRRLLTHHRAR
jgi:hypothetical protein